MNISKVIIVAGINEMATAWQMEAVRVVLELYAGGAEVQMFNARTYSLTLQHDEYSYRRWCMRFGCHLVKASVFDEALANAASAVFVSPHSDQDARQHLTQDGVISPKSTVQAVGEAIGQLDMELKRWKVCKTCMGVDGSKPRDAIQTIISALDLHLDVEVDYETVIGLLPDWPAGLSTSPRRPSLRTALEPVVTEAPAEETSHE